MAENKTQDEQNEPVPPHPFFEENRPAGVSQEEFEADQAAKAAKKAKDSK